MTKIYVASDHAGIELKSKILNILMDRGFVPTLSKEVHDMGPFSTDSVDYPDYANIVCEKLHSLTIIQEEPLKHLPPDLGILICGSGQGMCMRANKYGHVRAALCWTPQIAVLSREHNDANVLCLSARHIEQDINIEILRSFLSTPFAGGRHSQRVVKINSPT